MEKPVLIFSSIIMWWIRGGSNSPTSGCKPNAFSIKLQTHMKTISKNCKFCGKFFSTPLKEHNRGNGLFCSMSCAGKFNMPKSIKEGNLECAYCKERFYRQPSKMVNSKSKLYFCCRHHKDLAQRIGGIKEIHPTHYGKDNSNAYRRKALRFYRKECYICGFNLFPEIIIIHHIDLDRRNPSIENLIPLCPNCHAVIHKVLPK